MINLGIDSRQEAAKTAVIAGGTSGIGLATAIDLAKAADTIAVAPGTYNEAITFDTSKPINIVGNISLI